MICFNTFSTLIRREGERRSCGAGVGVAGGDTDLVVAVSFELVDDFIGSILER